MSLTWVWAAAATALGAAATGLAAGLVLRGEVVRLSVPGGEPEQFFCTECGAPMPGRPAWLCTHCGQWIGAPVAIELTAAGVVALLFAKFGGQPVVAAFVYLGVVGVALTQIDVAVQRLPDRLTLPAYPALLILLAAAAAVDDDWTAFGRAVLGALAIGAGYAVLSLASGGQVGGGDIKVAGLIGLLLGWLSWRTLITGAWAGFGLAAVAGVALLTAGRITRHSRISFGPYLLGGALLATLATAAPR